eukprot:COSAG01_NODE_32734_length_576_cov_1.171908_1_plen_78_part_10
MSHIYIISSKICGCPLRFVAHGAKTLTAWTLHETSAKNGYGVESAFASLASFVLDSRVSVAHSPGDVSLQAPSVTEQQ